MNRRLRKIRAWLAEPTQNTRGMTILAWTALTVTCFGGVAGAIVYVHDQREEQRQAIVAQCLQRVESRAQVRGVLLGLADRLGADLETLQIVSGFLDDEYPALDPADCLNPPTIPTPSEDS